MRLFVAGLVSSLAVCGLAATESARAGWRSGGCSSAFGTGRSHAFPSWSNGYSPPYPAAYPRSYSNPYYYYQYGYQYPFAYPYYYSNAPATYGQAAYPAPATPHVQAVSWPR